MRSTRTSWDGKPNEARPRQLRYRPAPAPTSPGGGPMTTPTILGRTAELRALTDLVEQAPDRGGALVLLGDAGIGKSTLIRAAAQHARAAGLQVLEIAGVEAEAQLPFAGLHQLLRPLLPAAGGLPAAQRRAPMSPVGAQGGAPPEPFMIALAGLGPPSPAPAPPPAPRRRRP